VPKQRNESLDAQEGDVQSLKEAEDSPHLKQVSQV
jgi:hypothetical protein